jgi:hypothetical protein
MVWRHIPIIASTEVLAEEMGRPPLETSSI